VSFSHYLLLLQRDGQHFLSLCAKSAPENSEKLVEGLGDAQDYLLLLDLQSRIDQLKSGIGKRYQARTQRGFLNVHNDTLKDVEGVGVFQILVAGSGWFLWRIDATKHHIIKFI